MSAATDELVHVDVDLTTDVPCNVTGCDNPAEWACLLGTCHHTVTVCDHCHSLLTTVIAFTPTPFLHHPPRCTVRNTTWTWRPL
ncbi:hypothetical protein Xcel_0581 [Xylanimonas cellulosilytica DSM 15894]|uniref:Uncharacterized protein n=1 Tax=Xylanimonas cellulosilytica (strain DSM 15894 / JCM 12276 / CECT 5975 / KCTC 9989 / LMG 20990 / NBRC 107835 / XIL07) TaxID=446471 RepID=D1BWN8_XYLCX|nr:hypothetical protein [Xylanimonas cellulosilytica]ACZ29620.1 hypothetical protein Xcel_0581 [Xylanimonas cellulosilytica DSM 15894]